MTWPYLVKTNMRDGFKGGMEIDEAVQVAKRLVQDWGSCVGA